MNGWVKLTAAAPWWRSLWRAGADTAGATSQWPVLGGGGGGGVGGRGGGPGEGVGVGGRGEGMAGEADSSRPLVATTHMRAKSAHTLFHRTGDKASTPRDSDSSTKPTRPNALRPRGAHMPAKYPALTCTSRPYSPRMYAAVHSRLSWLAPRFSTSTTWQQRGGKEIGRKGMRRMSGGKHLKGARCKEAALRGGVARRRRCKAAALQGDGIARRRRCKAAVW